ncbi:MAG: ParB/RepB/Spo0J family partition protein [Ruminococcaceae bacterium]|nr:ParB/RepB/Spo0J family partition protein [Oscillospiraceae bacterium]
MAKHGLGKGMDILFEDNYVDGKDVITMVDISSVFPDINQHRKTFNDESLAELAESITNHGVISPLLVKTVDNGYRIIAGERRYRASKLAGLTEIPVIIKEVNEQEAAEIALVENLQREDLNPIEEASGFEQLINAFGMTQEEAAKRVGKSRSALTNSLRLLGLPESAKTMLREGLLSAGHARALLPLNDDPEQERLLNDIVDKAMSVREVEQEVRNVMELRSIENGTAKPAKAKPDKKKQQIDESYLAHLKIIGERAGVSLGRSVKLLPGKDGAGKIVMEFYDSQDLEEILSALGAEDALS